MHRHPPSKSARACEAREHSAPGDLAESQHAFTSHQLELFEIPNLVHLPDTITVSIYVPCHRAGEERQQDPTVARNLIRDARQQVEITHRSQAIIDVLDAILIAIKEAAFWAHPMEGLVFFATANGWHFLWLPVQVPALATMAMCPHLKPIADFIEKSDRYYLLELTQHGVYLFAGTRTELRGVPLSKVPSSVDQATTAHLAEPYLEVRTTHGVSQGPAQIFGSIGDSNHKERIVHYFQQVDAQVSSLLHTENVPLVLAGVDYLVPLYRQVNHYAHLLPESIPGNPDLASTASLHKRSWDIVTAHHEQRLSEMGNRFTSLESHGKASRDLADILPAAVQGRISDLFVARNVDRWGTYLASNDRLHRHAQRRPEDEDLLNLALVLALRTRSRVHVVAQELMPDQAEIAAYFRF